MYRHHHRRPDTVPTTPVFSRNSAGTPSIIKKLVDAHLRPARIARRGAFTLGLLLVIGSSASAATPTGITVAVTGTTVSATGITPRGSAIVFGVVHERRRFAPALVRIEKMVTDEDGDGTISFDHQTLGLNSVWSVIDLADGRYGTGSPSGPAEPLALTKDPVVANNGQLKRIVLSLRSSHLLVVRPSVGVWGQVLVDGNAFDTDGNSDGTVNADISKSIDARGTKKHAPDKFERGDTVVIIDPFTLQLYAAQVGEKR